MLQTELQLAEQSAARLRSEAAIARRAAEQASAQLTSQLEQSRQSLRTESDHKASMAQQEQINLLRESNQALRWASGLAPCLRAGKLILTPILQSLVQVWDPFEACLWWGVSVRAMKGLQSYKTTTHWNLQG